MQLEAELHSTVLRNVFKNAQSLLQKWRKCRSLKGQKKFSHMCTVYSLCKEHGKLSSWQWNNWSWILTIFVASEKSCRNIILRIKQSDNFNFVFKIHNIDKLSSLLLKAKMHYRLPCSLEKYSTDTQIQILKTFSEEDREEANTLVQAIFPVISPQHAAACIE